MEQAKQGLFFDISVSDALPIGADHCGGRGPDRHGRVTIVRSRECPEADLAALKERFENDWRERHGIELPADALRFR